MFEGRMFLIWAVLNTLGPFDSRVAFRYLRHLISRGTKKVTLISGTARVPEAPESAAGLKLQAYWDVSWWRSTYRSRLKNGDVHRPFCPT